MEKDLAPSSIMMMPRLMADTGSVLPEGRGSWAIPLLSESPPSEKIECIWARLAKELGGA